MSGKETLSAPFPLFCLSDRTNTAISNEITCNWQSFTGALVIEAVNRNGLCYNLLKKLNFPDRVSVLQERCTESLSDLLFLLLQPFQDACFTHNIRRVDLAKAGEL